LRILVLLCQAMLHMLHQKLLFLIDTVQQWMSTVTLFSRRLMEMNLCSRPEIIDDSRERCTIW
uniref:Uncharacterized protein n=1 Tax=Amphimedon queenslandica TaxID=400682 RepID=A0A1X7TBK7_AMPQE